MSRNKQTPEREQGGADAVACQGGGGHGPFAWGWLDRALEEMEINPDFQFNPQTWSGSSAGAMNVIIAAHGMMAGGPARARADLAEFWPEVASFSRGLPSNPMLNGTFAGNPMADWLIYMNTEVLMHWLPWYRPVDIAPLRELIEKRVDFDLLKQPDAPRIFINASNARRIGQSRIFTNADLSPDAVVASAALPQLFQPVDIDGELYFDGGLTRNPPLPTDREDLFAIAINPTERHSVPKTAMELTARTQEIQLNAAFRRELEQIELHNDRLDAGLTSGLPVDHKVRLHLIEADGYIDHFSFYSRRMADWSMFQALFEAGRKAGQDWLDAHGADFRQDSTFRLTDKETAAEHLNDIRPLVPINEMIQRGPSGKNGPAPVTP